MYEPRQTARVLPSLAATESIARTTLRLNAVSDVHSGKSHTAPAASTVPAQVLKFFAVNVRPVMSRRYALTATESMHCGSPCSSRY